MNSPFMPLIFLAVGIVGGVLMGMSLVLLWDERSGGR